MGTEVLRPQDCFTHRIAVPPAGFSRRRTSGTHNNNYFRGTRKPVTRPEQRKRVVEKRPSFDDSRFSRLEMEKVTILRRGESLDSKLKTGALKKEGDNLVVVGTQRLGPDPDMVQKQIRIVDFRSGRQVYAGSAFSVSPSPTALPLPSFSKKQPAVAVADSATRDLRRLLRLE
ncbi:hypothetical protein AAZX31_15G095700 [Glycine max]|uniref:Uncharacterized protein n=2 Tax=Glycine subgen. Soja TaxID=1462606 RepID=I1MFA2_SOYBN|nr:hypothetical protein JHK86_041942 [Glycine max]RZB63914.1 hypothetical protein D0Y65_040478 [Glycine soja]KAG4956176.1 hypothetical protein JHK85_042556 [Glycine max]KAG5104914.1 hypothetical protein JHK82_041884 [Glycine max]KAG5116040.1 hypothetical protein JHK84_042153 [Glycine max]